MESDAKSRLPSKMIRFVLRKFHRNKDRDQKAKPSKPETINESNATTKKLTDLNDDCLESIFLYLSLADLVTIVDTNKHLRTAAELAFVRNFGRVIFVKWTYYYRRLQIMINDTEIVIPLPKPYRLLRCFGHLISKLEIAVQYKLQAYKLLKYVNKYCGESTTELVFELKSISYMNKPHAAETVSLQHCYLDKNHTRFRRAVRLNELFPNVRNLSICVSRLNRKRVAVHFPQLNQLKYDPDYRTADSADYHIAICVEMLHLNPQLRSLTLERPHIKTLLASQQLQFLERLEISHIELGRNKEIEINFPCLTELKVTHISGSEKILISAGNLRMFEFSNWGNFDNFNVDVLLDFLHDHRTITKFKLTEKTEKWEITNTRLPIDIIEALPLLEEMDISLLKISVNDAIRLVKNYKSLKLCFKTHYKSRPEVGIANVGLKCHLVCVKVHKVSNLTKDRHKLFCIYN